MHVEMASLAFPDERGEALTEACFRRRLLAHPKLRAPARERPLHLEDALHHLAPPPRGAPRVVWLDWGVLRGQAKYRAENEAWLCFLRDALAPRVPEGISVVASLALEAEGAALDALARTLPDLRGDKRWWTPQFWCTALDALGDANRVHVVSYLKKHGCADGILYDLAELMVAETGGRYEDILVLLRRGHALGSWNALLDALRRGGGPASGRGDY